MKTQLQQPGRPDKGPAACAHEIKPAVLPGLNPAGHQYSRAGRGRSDRGGDRRRRAPINPLAGI